MRFVAITLVLSLGGCSDVMEEHFATWADAERAGAVERGWIPAFVPKSATNIREVHNIDTNAQTLEFNFRGSDVQGMVAGLHRVSAEDQGSAAGLADDVGIDGNSEAYIVCSKPLNIVSEPLNGVLVFSRESGRAVYKKPVGWLDDDCLGAA
jgi:hypothetical protein